MSLPNSEWDRLHKREAEIEKARAEGYAAGYAAGQRYMRERAVLSCFENGHVIQSDRVGALPITEPPVLSTGEGPAEAGKEPT